MTYVMSDLHGCYDLYLKMLEKIEFSDDDILYLLGDYLDRGDKGFEIILDIARRKNVIPLMGNHDYNALSILAELSVDPDAADRADMARDLNLWMRNGGRVTYDTFWQFPAAKRLYLLETINSFEHYADIEVMGRRFTMVHGGIRDYDPDRPLDDYNIGDLAYVREDYSKPKFNDKDRFLVTGHTPTALIENGYEGKIFWSHDHIAIDCGAVWGCGLGCLCLETLEEYYVI